MLNRLSGLNQPSTFDECCEAYGQREAETLASEMAQIILAAAWAIAAVLTGPALVRITVYFLGGV